MKERIFNMMMVYNIYGTKVDYDYAVEMMDDDIREQLHNDMCPCYKQDFFTAYEFAHIKKYGDIWELSKENPTY